MYDEEILPPSHPLRTYLKSLDLDETTNDEILDKKSEKPKIFFMSDKLSRAFTTLARPFKLHSIYTKIIQTTLSSDLLVEDDHRVLLCHQDYIVSQPTSQESQSFKSLLFFILITATQFALPIITLTQSAFLLLFNFALYMIFPLLVPKLNMGVIHLLMLRLSELHLSLRQSIHFMQGVASSDNGLIYASSRFSQRKVTLTCLPLFLRRLHEILTKLIVETSEISKIINEQYDLQLSIDFSGSLRDFTDEIISATIEPTLQNIKSLFEFSRFLDSELIRRIVSLAVSEDHSSFLNFFRRLRAILSWYTVLRRAKKAANILNSVRTKLLMGLLTSDARLDNACEHSHYTSGSLNANDNVFHNRKLLSNLDSLQFHLVSWACRLHKLKTRIEQAKCIESADEISDIASYDLSLMRCLLQNCQLCLQEAEASLLSSHESPTSTCDTFEATTNSTKAEPTCLQILATVPEVEDEVLEGVAGDDTAVDDGSIESDFDGCLISRQNKKSFREGTQNRTILLTELKSVIAHRLLETQHRESKALLRSMGINMTSTLSAPSLDLSEVASETSGIMDKIDCNRIKFPSVPADDSSIYRYILPPFSSKDQLSAKHENLGSLFGELEKEVIMEEFSNKSIFSTASVICDLEESHPDHHMSDVSDKFNLAEETYDAVATGEDAIPDSDSIN